MWVLELNPGPLEEQSGLLVTGPPLQPHFLDALLVMLKKNLILTTGHHLHDCSLPSACRGWGRSHMYERLQKSKGNPSVLTCHLLEKGSATMHHCAHQGDSNLPGIVLCPLPIAPEEHQNYRHVLLCPDVCVVCRFKPRSSYLHGKGLTYWPSPRPIEGLHNCQPHHPGKQLHLQYRAHVRLRLLVCTSLRIYLVSSLPIKEVASYICDLFKTHCRFHLWYEYYIETMKSYGLTTCVYGFVPCT